MHTCKACVRVSSSYTLCNIFNCSSHGFIIVLYLTSFVIMHVCTTIMERTDHNVIPKKVYEQQHLNLVTRVKYM